MSGELGMGDVFTFSLSTYDNIFKLIKVKDVPLYGDMLEYVDKLEGLREGLDL